ncbi:MAG TPA: MFS transporter, partial [Candidatus Methylomirabilis sp.]|nr:MFS transporter [Candidatus Methylomirabilis sp.]
RPLMWASWGLGTVAVWAMAASASIEMFTAALVFYGLTAAVVAPMNSYITDARGNWSVGRAIAISLGSWQLGSVFGPLLGGQIGQVHGLRSVYFVGAVILTVSTLVIFFIRPQPVHPEVPAAGQSRLLHDPRFVTFLGMTAVVVFAAYLPQPLTPNFLQNQRGLSLVAIGQIAALSCLGNAVLSLALGHLSASLVFIIGQASVAVFSLLMWQGTGMAWYGIGAFFFGGYRLCRSMSIALTRPLVGAAELGLAYGLVETANSGAVMLAPLMAGIIYQQNPIAVYPLSLALLGITLAVSARYLSTRRHAPGEIEEPAEIEFVDIR